MLRPFLVTLTIALLTACRSDYASDDTAGGWADTGDWNDADTDWSDGAEDPDDDTWEPPPESEDDFLALRPAETDVFVFIANPGRDTVTRVNVYTQEVRTTEVGDNPSVVLTTRDYSTAVVLNKGDDTLTIIDSDTLESTTVDIRDNFNNVVLSPDGVWAAAWHDVRAEEPEDPPVQGLQSFNEVSFVHVPSGKHYPMAVGFNPREIQFTPDSSLSAVVSDEYLATVDLLHTPLKPSLIQVAEDTVTPPKAEEVVITPNGDWAFVRQFGASEIVVVDLVTRSVDRVPVGENPTDLDLSPDGTQAVVVSRTAKQLWVFDTADPVQIPPKVLDLGLPEDVSLGSLIYDPLGKQALVYTTASPTARYAVWDPETDEVKLRALVKPVRSMAITPTGGSVLVFHTKEDAPDADPSSPFKGSWALTLIDLGDYRTNPLKLPAEPEGYANASNGTLGFFIMKGQKFLEILDYRTLLYEQLPLKSQPVYVGVLPDLDPTDDDEPPAWVSQEHDLGRISFYEHDDATLETITGFELNSQIED